jgi:hypothetical protein
MESFESFNPNIKPDNILDRQVRRGDAFSNWFNILLKPALTILGVVLLGFVTMWMSLNYVKQDQFAQYVQQQLDADKTQDVVSSERFEIIQSKLELIINQQTSYTEQLKAYNQVMLGIQKQVDSLDDRVKYMERTDRTYKTIP